MLLALHVLLHAVCPLPVPCRMLAVTIGLTVPKQTGVVCVMVMEAPARWSQERFQPQISHLVSSRTDYCMYQHRNAARCNVLTNSLH